MDLDFIFVLSNNPAFGPEFRSKKFLGYAGLERIAYLVGLSFKSESFIVYG
ncbi:hypothetical protein [Zobellia sp. 1_MG-2023]|uniref:hypothetical protein n=1 Tax=Zobellia sp. 1_MG-2023 TaxID=3062626 RepID=UPI0026E1CB8D|nr:hypothetical protein [Zobellia sp. 1_MG-2023]MDO6818974.1 hypothetical protein [Zobellia sp. 1_MG-2023]